LPNIENCKHRYYGGNGDTPKDGYGILERGVAPQTAIKADGSECQWLHNRDYQQTFPKERLFLARETKVEAEEEGKDKSGTDQDNVAQENEKSSALKQVRLPENCIQ
jgi:hypothetical protein